MEHIERRDAGLLYVADEAVMEQQARARRLTQRLNTIDHADFESIQCEPADPEAPAKMRRIRNERG